VKHSSIRTLLTHYLVLLPCMIMSLNNWMLKLHSYMGS
jgi:hypothetical protein